jgi:hypothetical protein
VDRERWRRLRQVVDRALELSGEARASYLEAACSADPQLRADVERWLAADAAGGGVLEPPTGVFLKEAGRTRTSAERRGVRESPSPGRAFEPHERFYPGAVISGRYRIVARVGQGGMGDVYRADDLKLGQSVALKFLPQEFERDRGRLEQLLQEVRTARQVSHPNVCRVWDVGQAEGRHFLSMEYVDGEDLASLLRRIGRLPREKAVEIARQLCAGLAAVHGERILHRDLKPANVMLDGRGRVRLTDFGLAGLAEGSRAAESPWGRQPTWLRSSSTGGPRRCRAMSTRVGSHAVRAVHREAGVRGADRGGAATAAAGFDAVKAVQARRGLGPGCGKGDPALSRERPRDAAAIGSGRGGSAAGWGSIGRSAGGRRDAVAGDGGGSRRGGNTRARRAGSQAAL